MKPSPAAWLGAGLSAGANPPAFPDAADLDSANSAFSTTTSVVYTFCPSLFVPAQRIDYP